MLEESPVATAEEVVDKTLKRLQTLGNQKFASSPYSEHFSRWQADVAYVLSEFESSPNISVDEQFMKERSETLASVERKLEERRREEIALEEAVKKLSECKILLEHIQEEYIIKVGEIERQKNGEINRLNSKIDDIKGELDDIARLKAGLFRSVSKKAKAQKEAEATERLNTAQRELDLAAKDFTAEQERLRDEYERKKQSVIEQIQQHQKAIEQLEDDSSLEDRRVACEALVSAVNALLQRKTPQPH
jgi:DNA repair exonuclease SbcCD ATPase subunit